MDLKLVGAERYMDARLSADVLVRGTVVEDVADDLAEELLGETFRDALNNEHKVFAEVVSAVTKAKADTKAVDSDTAAQADTAKAPTRSPTRKRG